MIYLASYKHKKKVTSLKSAFQRAIDEVVRWLDKGIYSHNEIAIQRKDGLYECYSSSSRDGGVRKKVMPLPSDRWDLIPLNVDGKTVVNHYRATNHQSYDYAGALGLFFGVGEYRDKSFCSEWIFNAIYGSDKGWRFSPNDLVVIFVAQTNKGH